MTTTDTRTTGRAVTILVPLPFTLLTINERRRLHWSAERKEVASQREAVGWLAKQQLPPDFRPLVGRVRLDVEIRPHRGQRIPDPGARWEATKVWIDGLQDAGVFEKGDDNVVEHGTLVWDRERRIGELVMVLTELEA